MICADCGVSACEICNQCHTFHCDMEALCVKDHIKKQMIEFTFGCCADADLCPECSS